jgi:hypothetical protein
LARYLLLEVILHLSNWLSSDSFYSVSTLRCLFARTLSFSIVLLASLSFRVLIYIMVVTCHHVFILEWSQILFILHMQNEQIIEDLLCLSVDITKQQIIYFIIISLCQFCFFFNLVASFLFPRHYWDHVTFKKQWRRLGFRIKQLWPVFQARSSPFSNLLNDINFKT